MDYIEKIGEHILSHLSDRYRVSYITAHYDTLQEKVKADNNRYKEQNIIACMLLNPNFKNVYAKKDKFAYDGTITLGVNMPQSDMIVVSEEIREFTSAFNGYFITDNNIRFKYKTNFATETVEQSANGNLYNIMYITLGVHITNMLMGDEIKFYLNDTLIDDYERSFMNANETYSNTLETNNIFSNYIVGNKIQMTFAVEFAMSWINNIQGLDNQVLKVVFGTLGEVEYKGKVTNINPIVDKNREVLITFNFEVDADGE